MATTSSIPVHILGAGPSGALTALALSIDGFSIVLCDPQTVSQLQSRSRAYAITHSSRRLLQSLDLWDALLPSLIPFKQLDLRDQGSRGRVLFELADLDQGSQRHQAIGWILDHAPLMQLLLKRLQAVDSVDLHLGSTPPPPAADALVIAADGPRSPARSSWRIRTWTIRYSQGCLTAKVLLRGVPSGTAYELFRPEGPLAVLPLSDGRYQVVWSAPMDRCRERAELPESAFLDLLASVLPEGVEPDLLLDQPHAIPQQLMLARRLSSGRGLLVGEAGHRCHPVGGQGLNLCWRDVQALKDLLKRPGSAQGLARHYAWRRLPDVLMVGLATDLLVRLFSNRQPLLLPMRWIGLWCLTTSGWLRRLSLRVMTDGPMHWGQPLAE